jgi:glucokinase
MNQTDFPRLLGDIGGTNARFAWQARAEAYPSEVVAYACADHGSLLLAMRHYLEMHDKPPPAACAIGIANPITGDEVRMTNHHWSFSISALQGELGVLRLVVINDFTALALSLPALTRADLRPIGGGKAVAGAPLAVLGPGTGLGASGLFPLGLAGGFLPINGEGGHVSLAPADDHEAAIIGCLQRRFGHASAERALSGPGLVNLYDATCSLAGAAAERLAPSEVLERALSGVDPHCTSALDLFCSFLGNVAGNLALTLGALGGVYIGGGIAPRIVGEIERSMFRGRFEAKGRFADYLAGIPTFVIDAQMSPALLGAAKALDQADGTGR